LDGIITLLGYKLMLLRDRRICAWTTCPGLHSTVQRLEFEVTTYSSLVQHPNQYHKYLNQYLNTFKQYLVIENFGILLIVLSQNLAQL